MIRARSGVLSLCLFWGWEGACVLSCLGGRGCGWRLLFCRAACLFGVSRNLGLWRLMTTCTIWKAGALLLLSFFAWNFGAGPGGTG